MKQHKQSKRIRWPHFINHDEHGTLRAVITTSQRRADFYAARDIEIGDELTYDYGTDYWDVASRALIKAHKKEVAQQGDGNGDEPPAASHHPKQ